MNISTEIHAKDFTGLRFSEMMIMTNTRFKRSIR